MAALKRILSAGLASFAILGSLSGVQVDSNAVPNRALFQIEFPGETRGFLAREEAINSISKQEYITGAFRVVEVNVVTEGNALLRIYYSRPLKAGEAKAALDDATAAATGGTVTPFRSPLPDSVRQMADRAGGAAEAVTGNTVIKEYPIATHAGTIEFRVRKRSEVIELYDELMKHWTKEPAFFENDRIVSEDEATQTERRPRSLGGTIFTVEE